MCISLNIHSDPGIDPELQTTKLLENLSVYLNVHFLSGLFCCVPFNILPAGSAICQMNTVLSSLDSKDFLFL